MENTFGKRISTLRREKGMKQEELAERMGVSPQAVSKWENDQTCPDISALPELAKILGISVDELLTGKKEEPSVSVVSAEEREKNRVLHLEVVDGGDKVRINLPIQLVRAAVEIGLSLSEVSGDDTFKNVDIKSILALVEQGVVGNILEVESADGENVKIFVD